jgi:broad-specificity NMP kinase
MDAFVKILPQKKERPQTLHQKEIDTLERCIKDGENVFVCGSSGSGKTFIVNQVLDKTNSLELHSDFFQKKHSYIDFLGDTNISIIIDGYDQNTYGHKHLIDKISTENFKITKGSVVVISNSIHIIPNFKLLIVPRRSADEISSLESNNERAYVAAEKCCGNIRNFYHYLDYSDLKDEFKSSKDIIIDILCKPTKFDNSQTVHEHGHVRDVINGNYLNSEGCDMVKISESLSLADVLDVEMYKGEWRTMPYYICAGISVPKYYMGKLLNPSDIKPGSTWTKYGNYKMRYQKLKNIRERSGNRLSAEELQVIKLYAIKGDFSRALSYNIEPSDFDVINHLSLHNKLKSNDVIKLKKKMRAITNEL